MFWCVRKEKVLTMSRLSREEEIREVARFHANKFSTRNGYTSVEDACVETALWCDANPKSPWIRVETGKIPERDILPNGERSFQSERVFVLKEYGVPDIAVYDHVMNAWQSLTYGNYVKVLMWMPVPEALLLNPIEEQ